MKSVKKLNIFAGEVQKGPVAVIDIGSNSVRMVVYEGAGRAPIPMFNEKAMCGLGRGLMGLGQGKVGRLADEPVEQALITLRRFSAIADGMKVKNRIAIATSAVRDAENGGEFAEQAAKILGTEIQILSGPQEAELAGYGVAGSLRDAQGIVGDFGGGSLELCEISGRDIGERVSFPIGALRLAVLGQATSKEVDDAILKALDSCEWLHSAEGQTLYVVGGAWRVLGRMHMAHKNHPIRILHQYDIPASGALAMADLVAHQSLAALGKLPEVPSRRVETLPYAGRVLEHLIERANIKRLIFSAHGVREGVIYSLLSQKEWQRDPLVASCDEMGRQFSSRAHRVAHKFIQELFDWMQPFFPGESPKDQRRRMAACALSDIAWRTPSDYRGQQAYVEIMRAPLLGMGHEARAQIALSVLHRYQGGVDDTEAEEVANILPEEVYNRAREIGMALRLGEVLSGGLPGVMPSCPLTVADNHLALSIPEARRDFAGEVTETRLGKLAATRGMTYSIDYC